MKILKFGGTSVGSPEAIRQTISIILNARKENKIAVVVSAFSKITDLLIETATLASQKNEKYLKNFKEIKNRHLKAVKELIKNPKNIEEEVQTTLKELENLLYGIYLTKELSNKTLDLVMSFGERLSAYIISQSLNEKIPTKFLDARKLVKTNDNFGYGKVDFEKTNKNIKEFFKKHSKLQIITGFIGSTENDVTVTLGRGGSDYSAAIFGAALNAEEIEIWTDVDGIMTADPRKVKKAFSLKEISYIEAMEMSHFGAKVIHPPTMLPAMQKNIPIRIKNTFNPEFPGSVIGPKQEHHDSPIKGISSISNIALLRLQGSGMVGIPGVSKRLFGALSNQKINVILISQASSEHSICFAIDPNSTEKAREAIQQEFEFEIRAKQIDEVIIEKDLSIIAVVGENMRKSVGISGKVFQALGRNGINIIAIAQGSSELNISIVIHKDDEAKAIRAIHDALFLSEIKSLNLFLIGPGLVGKTLIKQINEQADFLKENYFLEIKTVALANSKKMIFNEDGIDLKEWEKNLKTSKEKMNLEKFLEKMFELNLPNSVFVDCTSSEEITQQYEKIITKSISIVTPNKKANSSNLKSYIKLIQAASKSNAKFKYETNVGAGLPIIRTLQDLLLSGDKILKIEAVLSGTLSYIFNNFDGKKPFSEIVKEAKEKGYTEPDPRDDLNGLDFARKMLILAREIGQFMELSDIEIENLIPENCRKAKNIEDFFKEFKKADNFFEEKRSKAAKNKKKLCFIGTLENNIAKIKLEEIDQNHPFSSLSGSDNIISFTTSRYTDRPLVIKGPGAGAEVTAAGVFAEIINIANVSFNTKLAKYSFAEKLKKNRLVITLVGMSNIGKTTWSKKLTNLGFKHINCDDLIEKKLKNLLKEHKGITGLAAWLGNPHENKFKEREKKLLETEDKVMEEIINSLKIEGNTVMDTSGSVIYIKPETLKILKKNSLVVYIESTPEIENEMFEHFLKHPKPVIWGGIYKIKNDESKEQALRRCYKELLEYRKKQYKEIADIIVPCKKVDSNKVNENEFLSIIQENL